MKKNQRQKKFTSIAVALSAASLFGCAETGHKSEPVSASPNPKTDLAHCYGVNKCGGHNDCKTASNACAGHASCKGQGFVAMPSKACADVGGSVKDAWRGEVNTADLAKCYDVNVCKGHNDCKTANNACGGHASCKGTGFVKMPAKACKDIGGTVKS